ncbi:binder of sperm protein homolog 1 [Talpa occidentalis]|uniref:binder of sperm protein homolog 1 n=1 Tax=Talpa occidentalis TaxID=50954 RepID=UPI00188DCC2C|nr:binder of sperm protein homolog 1 [Talpa occidentalis]
MEMAPSSLKVENGLQRGDIAWPRSVCPTPSPPYVDPEIFTLAPSSFQCPDPPSISHCTHFHSSQRSRGGRLSISTGAVTYFAEVKDGNCSFPFHYRKRTFYDCIKSETKHSWCSLNKTYQGYWKYCSEEDFAKCVFPFWYKRLIYWECTEDGDSFGKKWCSLTQNYNKNNIWKYCD